MIKVNDLLYSGFEVRKVIDVQDDYCVTILLEDLDGLVDQDADNIGEFILLNDIKA